MKWRCWVGFLLAVNVSLVHARPSLEQGVGPTIAQTGSSYYQFYPMEAYSRDGDRHYRVWVGVPRRPAPALGYPAAYLLDGNAALAELSETDLGELDRLGPPVIVALGYATERRFDVVARAYDYTPPLAGGAPATDELDRGRRGGGADEFLDLLQQRIRPRIEAAVKLDPSRQLLWGHSYGGLFVLHTLFTRPDSFARYAAAEPSLWWQKGRILEEMRERAQPKHPARLLLMQGDPAAERRSAPPANADPKAVAARRAAVAAVPETALREMASELAAQPGWTVSYRQFAGLSHGPMLPASLMPALRWASGAASSSEAPISP